MAVHPRTGPGAEAPRYGVSHSRIGECERRVGNPTVRRSSLKATNMAEPADRRFVSRGGEKLEAALGAFGLRVEGKVCADLGSHVGGFVDCLLQREAARVYSVDTAYGLLAWKLRRDPRVVVRERTNALHVELPELVDVVTIDVGWTPQAKILPRAASISKAEAQVVTLIKPHYEADRALLQKGVLPDDTAAETAARVLSECAAAGWVVRGSRASPIRGHGGNQEYLAWLEKKEHSTHP